MARSSSVSKTPLRDPRVVLRAAAGILLAANLAAAVAAFHPFGGGADDLRRSREALRWQLSRARMRLAASQQLVAKVEKARSQSDKFLAQYFTDEGSTAAIILAELTEAAKQAGIRMGTAQCSLEPIEGSDTLQMLSAQVGFEGAYTNLTKFIHLLDQSPRFLIIESLQAAAPQQQNGQLLNVTLKIDAFVKGVAK
jgi:Tfp pilus assembly protein PilO